MNGMVSAPMICTQAETRDLGFEWCRLSGEPLGFCDCGTCTGEWGAWRAVLRRITAVAAEQKKHHSTLRRYRTNRRAELSIAATKKSAKKLLDVVGWSL